MRDRYSVVMQRLILELRGIPCLEFEDVEPRRQIIASRSFGERVTDKDSLIEAVTMHATRAAEKLCLDGSACGVMQVGIRTGQHNPQEEQYSRSVTIRFPVPTADTRKLIGAGRAAIDRIYKTGPRYAKAEVALLDLVPADGVQTGLFDQGDSEKAAQFMQTIDQLNRVNGRQTVFFASEGKRKDWAMKGERKTQSFTTQWAEIPGVR